MSERSIQNNFAYYLRKQGAKVVKFHGGPFTEKGTPDLLGAWHGRSLAIEVKQPGGRLSDIQRQRLREWRAAGARAGVVWTFAGLRRLLSDSPAPHCQKCGGPTVLAPVNGSPTLVCAGCGATSVVLEEELYEG